MYMIYEWTECVCVKVRCYSGTV